MKYILLGYRHPSCKLYTPEKNKKKAKPQLSDDFLNGLLDDPLGGG